MKTTQRRSIALLVAVAVVAGVIVLPRMSGAQGTPTASPAAEIDPALISMGEQVYSTVCLACHQAEGAGVEGFYPALAGNPFVTLEDPRPVVQTVLNGRGGMPRFGGSYSDEEIAGIVSYIRQAWGNQAAPVSPDVVAEVRAQFEAESPADATPIPSPPPGASPEADATPAT